MLLRQPRDARGHLPPQRLAVEAALPRHHQVSGRDPVGQADGVGHQVEPGRPLGPEGEQGEPQTPSRAGTGPVAQAAQPGIGLDLVRPRPQGVVEAEHHRPICTLLRPEHSTCAIGAQQRVVDVGRRDQLEVKTAVEHLPHAAPAVVRPRSAEPDHDASRAVFPRGGHQSPNTAGARHHRVALLGCDQVQAARLRGLDVRRPIHEQHFGLDWPSERVVNCDAEELAAEPGAERVDEPRPAVGQRREVELVTGRRLAPPGCDRLGRLDGTERAAEGVRRDENSHDDHPPVPVGSDRGCASGSARSAAGRG